MKDYFSAQETERMARWLAQMAEAEMAIDNIPENNWMAKPIKLVSTIGLEMQKQEYSPQPANMRCNFQGFPLRLLYFASIFDGNDAAIDDFPRINCFGAFPFDVGFLPSRKRSCL